MHESFGSYIRGRREALKRGDASFSLRKVAGRIGVEPSYLSKVERGEEPPPSEEKIKAIAGELDEDADVLLDGVQNPGDPAIRLVSARVIALYLHNIGYAFKSNASNKRIILTNS